jgi:hypothetical protein
MPIEQNTSMMRPVIGSSSATKERWLDRAVDTFSSLEVVFSLLVGFAGERCCRQRRLKNERNGKMVPPAGIEPALPKERDFESRASTNSARGATQGRALLAAPDRVKTKPGPPCRCPISLAMASQFCVKAEYEP